MILHKSHTFLKRQKHRAKLESENRAAKVHVETHRNTLSADLVKKIKAQILGIK